MKRLRRVHLLVGCLVAPGCLFLAVTGVWQAFDLHRGKKDGTYRPPRMVAALSTIHMNEYFREVDKCGGIADPAEMERCKKEQEEEAPWRRTKAKLLTGMILVGAAGLFLNAVTGVWMALQLKGWRSYAMLLTGAGVLLPAALLLL